jgi:hypothetical protein
MRHHGLNFAAEMPLSAYAFEQTALTAAEESGEYEQPELERGECPAFIFPLRRLILPIVRPLAAGRGRFLDIDIRLGPEYSPFRDVTVDL